MLSDREVLIAELKKEEGLRLYVYDDYDGSPISRGSVVRGTPTIGYGRNAGLHGGIRDIEAEFMLRNDVSELEVSIPAALSWFSSIDAVRRRVLVSMAFQMGLAGLLGFHDTLGLVAAGKYSEAAEAMLASDWARRTPARAERMAQLMRGGSVP